MLPKHDPMLPKHDLMLPKNDPVLPKNGAYSNAILLMMDAEIILELGGRRAIFVVCHAVANHKHHLIDTAEVYGPYQ